MEGPKLHKIFPDFEYGFYASTPLNDVEKKSFSVALTLNIVFCVKAGLRRRRFSAVIFGGELQLWAATLKLLCLFKEQKSNFCFLFVAAASIFLIRNLSLFDRAFLSPCHGSWTHVANLQKFAKSDSTRPSRRSRALKKREKIRRLKSADRAAAAALRLLPANS